MKPDWKDAPEWAQWLAMDDDGKWYWFSGEPIMDEGFWTLPRGDLLGEAQTACISRWKETLEARP